MNKDTQHSGMTLIELVIGMGLMSVILTVLATTFSQNSRAAVQANVKSDAQQETLNAQQLITGRLREAFYVWPGSQTMALGSSTNPSPSFTYQNPIAGPRFMSSNWLTGSDPIIAMILPPANSALSCETDNAGCYRFYAYYPVNRKVWTDTATGSNNPGVDEANSNAWLLVQYNAYLKSNFNPYAVATTIPTASDVIAYDTANTAILADYISPTSPDFVMTTTNYIMFTLLNSSGAVPSATVPVNQVQFKLASSRIIGNKAVRLPSATDNYTISVSLINQGKIAGS